MLYNIEIVYVSVQEQKGAIMSKRNLYILYALLAAVLLLLAMLIIKTNRLYSTQLSGMNLLSEKLDALTSYVKMMNE